MVNFIIIGAQRAGTQSFYKYLLQHPSVVPATKSDVRFFDLHYEQGMDWYIQHFPLLSGYYGNQKLPGHITGEASPSYFHHPLAPERMKHHCPHAKLIVLLRNPIDRAYSHYRHAVRIGKESMNFPNALLVEGKRTQKGIMRVREFPHIYAEHNLYYSYLSHGLYAAQIKRWLAYFPRNQLHFIRSEDYFIDPLTQVMETYQFLGLSRHTPMLQPSPTPISPKILSDQTRDLIGRFFQYSNEETFRLLKWQPVWDTETGVQSK